MLIKDIVLLIKDPQFYRLTKIKVFAPHIFIIKLELT